QPVVSFLVETSLLLKKLIEPGYNFIIVSNGSCEKWNLWNSTRMHHGVCLAILVAYSHRPGVCRHVAPITDGSEDIALLPDGQVVLTTGLRYTNSDELKGVTGHLFYYKFGQSKAEQVKIKWTDEKLKIFNPHGMKPFIDQKGTIYLYVVNHEPHADNIEIFEYDPKVNMAVHVKTINHELIFK
uniref:Uncharacterized protein n=1 Tax=Romanomermis culicivorax TaxID=13658 RepID=A0A915JR56_ROMCU